MGKPQCPESFFFDPKYCDHCKAVMIHKSHYDWQEMYDKYILFPDTYYHSYDNRNERHIPIHMINPEVDGEYLNELFDRVQMSRRGLFSPYWLMRRSSSSIPQINRNLRYSPISRRHFISE